MEPEATWPLQGTWYNELGSTMVIGALDPTTQTMIGSYTTAVSSSGCAQGKFMLAGRSDVQAGGQTVGWAVSWLNTASKCWSTTSWAGHFDGQATITTFWLLATKADPGEEWASTVIGQDVFKRTPPTEDEVAQTLRTKRHSHP
jgi:Avidin family